MANFDNFVGYKKTMGVTYNAPHKDLFYFKCLEARQFSCLFSHVHVQILKITKSDKNWNKILNHAMTCVDVPTNNDQTFHVKTTLSLTFFPSIQMKAQTQY